MDWFCPKFRLICLLHNLDMLTEVCVAANVEVVSTKLTSPREQWLLCTLLDEGDDGEKVNLSASYSQST